MGAGMNEAMTKQWMTFHGYICSGIVFTMYKWHLSLLYLSQLAEFLLKKHLCLKCISTALDWNFTWIIIET